jgi:hypothetical protein
MVLETRDTFEEEEDASEDEEDSSESSDTFEDFEYLSDELEEELSSTFSLMT